MKALGINSTASVTIDVSKRHHACCNLYPPRQSPWNTNTKITYTAFLSLTGYFHFDKADKRGWCDLLVEVVVIVHQEAVVAVQQAGKGLGMGSCLHLKKLGQNQEKTQKIS